MAFLIISGVIALIFGVLLLVSPEGAKKISLKVSTVVNNVDNFIYKYNQGIGLSLILSGLTLLFVAYYLYKISGNA